MKVYRPTIAKINISNLRHNIRQIRRIVGKSVMIMPTVKAHAYGHGIIPTAKELVGLGVDFLGVASLEEGITLRKSGIKCPILVLGSIFKSDVAPVLDYNLRQTVFSYDLALALDKEAAKRNAIVLIHLKVDTGMGRLGISEKGALGLILKINKLKNVKLEGIFTHFPMADTNREFTNRQIKVFNDIVHKASGAGINIPIRHAANSAGLIDYKSSHFNLVRPGLMMYGINPKKSYKPNLKPVLSLVTRIMHVKMLPYGFGVSYGHTYVTKKPTKIAILPIGYGDGYLRIFSNKSEVLIGGKRCKILGNICMDQMMADVTALKSVSAGDEAVLIGKQGLFEITAEELAKLAKTIPYEIVCNIGGRIPRVYTWAA